MTQIYNFSAGPAVCRRKCSKQAAAEMLDWHGSGMSVMEMSHRGPEFISIYKQAEADLRELLAVPANYQILFLQGGGLGENAIVPMNLVGARQSRPRSTSCTPVPGPASRSRKRRATRSVNVAASAEAERFSRVPPQDRGS